MTKTLHPALFAALALGVSGVLTSASADVAAPYDPVARAIALGLTPEAVDAAFDSALAAAESCDSVAVAMQTMSCTPHDVATLNLPVLLPLGS